MRRTATNTGANTGANAEPHGALMDSIYRRQKYIYDATRKFYLFGRDRLIEELAARPGMALLEVGCGTGRNLAVIGRRWPGLRLYGLDISEQMLMVARAKLGSEADLALGDATSFEAATLFDTAQFDRIVMSFTISMIPGWQTAIDQAARHLAPGGELHMVDFGDFAGMPGPVRALFYAWLRKFHVTPRRDLEAQACALAQSQQLIMHSRPGPLGYYRVIRLVRPF